MLYPELLQRLCRARALLRDWEQAPLPVSAVARRIGLSPFHFIRLFKAVFGTTPHQLRSQAQIERAQHLLLLTDATVTDICMAVGFSSVGSFSALFTRRVGTSPTAFRRRHASPTPSPRRLPAHLIPGCFSLMAAIPPPNRNFGEARPRRVC